MEGSTSTDLKKALTSNDVMVSPGCSFDLLDVFHKVLCIFLMVWRLTYQEVDDACKHCGHPIGDYPLLDTIGLREVPTLWILGSP